jgi:hypothetical protein
MGDVLSTYCENEPFKHFIYFQKLCVQLWGVSGAQANSKSGNCTVQQTL